MKKDYEKWGNNIMNIRKIIAAAVIGAFTFATVGCSMVEKTPEAIKKSTVAQVGSEKITRGELDENPLLSEQLNALKAQYGENYGTNAEIKDQLVEYKKQILDQMIQEKLVLQHAKDYNINSEDAAIKEQVDKSINDMIKQNFANDKNKFAEELKKIGTTEEILRNFYKNQIVIEKINDQIAKDVKVDDATAKKYYDENIYQFLKKPAKFHASHILVKTEEEAKKVKERLDKKEDFAKVAKEVSLDGSKEKGGDLGEMEYSGVVKPFADAVVKLNKGETSGIVKSEFGYHIIKLTDKEAVEFKGFAEVKEQIKKELLDDEKQKAFTNKVQEWKKSGKIETEKYEKNLI